MITTNRKLWLWPCAALLCSSIYLSAQKQDVPNNFEQEADSYYSKVLEELEGIPGFAITVVKGDETLLAKGYGYADLGKNLKSSANTNYYIASSTKSFTALLASILDQEGIIKLEDPITKYFPDISFDPDLEVEKIRIQDLFTHTTGINNGPISFRAAYSGDHDLETLYRLMEDTEANKAGYGNFQYTNVGYNIYSIIVDKHTGKTWQELLEEKVFSPLSMNRTTAYMSKADKHQWELAKAYMTLDQPEEVYLMKKDNTMQAAGGLITTANDLANWLKVQLNQGSLDGKQVFPKSMIEYSQQPLVDHTSGRPPFNGEHYGMGWQVGKYQENQTLYHFGGFPGFSTHVSFMPEKGIGVAVMVNEAISGYRLMSMLATFAYDHLLEVPDTQAAYDKKLAEMSKQLGEVRKRIKKGQASRAKRKWKLSKPFSAYAGTFANDQYGIVHIAEGGGALKVSMGNMYCIATPYTQEETIRVEMVPGSGEVIEFQFEEEDLKGFKYSDLNFEKIGSSAER